MNIMILVVGLVIVGLLIALLLRPRETDKKILLITKEQIEKEIKQLEETKEQLNTNIKDLQKNNEYYDNQYNKTLEHYNKLTQSTQEAQIKNASWEEKIKGKAKEFELSEQNCRKAFENFCLRLDQDYEEKQKQNEEDLEALQKLYSDTQESMRDIFNEAKEIRKTYMIMGEQQQKQMIEEEKQEFYKIHTDAASVHDIKILKEMSEQLNNKSLVDKLIWSTFYQKQSKAHFVKILGAAKTICGIYKITNTETGQIYIGQSVDVLERWTEHIKEGLNVGKSKKANKLYDNMRKYGVEVFTWELLEECDSKYLDEKEKFYIQSFAADVYGLNSTAGNG